MKVVLFFILMFLNSIGYAIDKFDIIVCNALGNISAQIDCYKKLNITINSCTFTTKTEELRCYRDEAWCHINSIKENKKTSDALAKIEAVIKDSDDFSSHKEIMLKLSQQLIDQGKCTLADFEDMGGWVQSFKHKPKPVYFTYCGDINEDSRIYLDAEKKSLFK